MDDLFFGLYIDRFAFWGKCLVLFLSVLCGGLIGYERQCKGNAAGMRTHILVCLGSTLLTLTAVELLRHQANGDPTRMGGQIVSGIGFLGAGAILRDGMTVHGLTTAASIWVTAGIGITMGSSPHLGELAVLSTVVVLVTLVLLTKLEDRLKIRSHIRILTVEIGEQEEKVKRLLDLLNTQGITLVSMVTEQGRKGGHLHTQALTLRIELPSHFVRSDFMRLLAQNADITAFSLE